jgi:hypothetical protein
MHPGHRRGRRSRHTRVGLAEQPLERTGDRVWRPLIVVAALNVRRCARGHRGRQLRRGPARQCHGRADVPRRGSAARSGLTSRRDRAGAGGLGYTPRIRTTSGAL